MNPNKSKERMATEHFFEHLPAGAWATREQVEEATGIKAQKAIGNMLASFHLVARKVKGQRAKEYQLTTTKARKALMDDALTEKQRLWSSGRAAAAMDDDATRKAKPRQVTLARAPVGGLDIDAIYRKAGPAASANGPLLLDAKNGPGHSPAKRPVGLMPVDAGQQIITTLRAHPSHSTHQPVLERPPYDAPELKPQPGILPDRLEAFSLPSRIGNQLHYPDGRVELLDGGRA